MARKKLAAAEAEVNEETGATERTEPGHMAEVETPDAIREHLKEAKANMSQSFVQVAKYLYLVRRDSLFKEWGFKKFKDYVQDEVDFEIRKAEQLCEIYEMYCVNLPEHRPDAPHVIEEIGWTKAHRLLPALNDDGSNLDEWLDKAKADSVRELEKAVKGPKGEKPERDDSLVKRKFILTPEQDDNLTAALNAVARATDGEEPGKLLDLLATYYLATDPENFVDAVVPRIEENTGLRLIVLNPDGSVKYGGDYVDQIK